MERTYDIFEVNEDGSLSWRDAVSGHDAALARMHELAAHSTREFRMLHLPSHSIVVVLNAKEQPAKPNEAAQTKTNGKTKLSLRTRTAKPRKLFTRRVSQGFEKNCNCFGGFPRTFPASKARMLM